MLQHSKLHRSRNSWREKAVKRADEIREYRKQTKRYQQKIAALKEQLGALSPPEKGGSPE